MRSTAAVAHTVAHQQAVVVRDQLVLPASHRIHEPRQVFRWSCARMLRLSGMRHYLPSKLSLVEPVC